MTPEPRSPARPRLLDREAWLHLVQTLQASARAQQEGMAVVTLRLAVRDGLLVGWCEPTIQRWHSGADTWLAGQNVNLYEEGTE